MLHLSALQTDSAVVCFFLGFDPLRKVGCQWCLRQGSGDEQVGLLGCRQHSAGHQES